MKPVKLFFFAACPHCQKAQKYLAELQAENPDYAAVTVEKIDEKLQPEIADRYDYYYVPTFFVDEQKVHEGTATREDVEAVLKQALAD